MKHFIAFLRGINVGGHRVKMDRLRGLFGEMGLRDVSTFIASGNVIFSTDSGDAESWREKIELHLAEGLGYEVPTFLRTPDQLAEVALVTPPQIEETEETESSAYVIFLHAPASTEMRSALEGLSSEMDQFRFSGTEVYWLIKGKLSESPLFSKGLEKAFQGATNTMRNLNTVRRLVSKTQSLVSRPKQEGETK